MEQIDALILIEEEKLARTSSPNEIVNILYNLIFLKNNHGIKSDSYKDTKRFIDHYIEVIKVSDYGYDNLNYEKIEIIINVLSYPQQINVLKYAISVMSRELPEHDKSWFIQKSHKAEINHIIKENIINQYFKAFFLFAGLTTKRVLFVLLSLYIIITIILLPAASNCFIFFTITYEKYSDVFFVNHILNVLTLFAGLSNKFEIQPINWLGLIFLVIAKILFLLLIVNFFYRKLSDKISIK